MIDEECIRSALLKEASQAELLPKEDLWMRIVQRAYRPGFIGWWGRLAQVPKVGMALVTFCVLTGFVGYVVLPATSVDQTRQPAANHVMTADQMAKKVGFDLAQPTYLPSDVELFESRLEVVGVGADVAEVAALYYMTPSGRDGVTILQWRGTTSAVLPAGDLRNEGFRSSTPLQDSVNGKLVTRAQGSLSGQPVIALYWSDNGVNHSVLGLVSLEELRKVAASLQ